MKKIILSVISAVLLIALVVSCEKTTTDDKIPADQAKVELRSASQQLTAEMNTLTNTPCMVTLNYLADLTSEESWKSTLEAAILDPNGFSYHNIKDLFVNRDRGRQAQADYMSSPGIYQFNFDLNNFELIETSTTMIKMIYPANEQAFAARLLNAELLANNLQFTVINYSDNLPDGSQESYSDTVITNADLSMKIDQAEAMNGNYHCTMAPNGFPTSLSLSLNMCSYELSCTFSGSGTNYTSSMSAKLNGAELLGFELAVNYTSDMNGVDRVSGSLRMPPVRYEGSISVNALMQYTSTIDSTQNWDLDYMNSLVNILIYNIESGGELGKMIFQLYTDPETGEKSPTLAVLYEDGSWEYLSDIMSSNTTKFAFMRPKILRLSQK